MATQLPTFEFYCGSNALRFDYGNGLTVWFSYQTPVAFARDGRKVVRENDWSNTTGKHLNSIDGGDKDSRIPGKDFENLLKFELAKGTDFDFENSQTWKNSKKKED